ncbi:PHP domain-containing protein, partial [bacterium]|nr:PHP domain-containing protein [bacterium]
MYFTHLHVHSHYSLLDGMSKIDELVDLAQQMNLDALALTDHGVLHGAIEFYKKARKKGIKPIIGCEVYLAPRSLYDKRPKIDTKLSHLVLLAKDFTGYQNLLKLVTIGELEGFYYKPRIDKKVLREHSEGLIGLSACLKGEIPQAILAKKYSKAKELIKEYQDIFGPDDFYLELQDHLEIPEQREVNKKLLQLSEEMKVKAVVTCDSHYPRKEDKRVHDVFLAIQTGTGIDDEERLRMTQT